MNKYEHLVRYLGTTKFQVLQEQGTVGIGSGSSGYIEKVEYLIKLDKDIHPFRLFMTDTNGQRFSKSAEILFVSENPDLVLSSWKGTGLHERKNQPMAFIRLSIPEFNHSLFQGGSRMNH